MKPRAKRWILIPLALFLLLAGVWLVRNSRLYTESPAYTVERTDGAFEVRAYPELQVAVTPSGEADRNGAFRRLFQFITGGNAEGQSIAMTTPVLMADSPAGRSMGFIVPGAVAAAGAPAPTGERVALTRLAPARMAVFRFDGGGDASAESSALATLRDWMTRQGLTAAGDPSFAYYDPPWTPGFLRRSEVMVPIRAP